MLRGRGVHSRFDLVGNCWVVGEWQAGGRLLGWCQPGGWAACTASWCAEDSRPPLLFPAGAAGARV